jgi:hypothetical protein
MKQNRAWIARADRRANEFHSSPNNLICGISTRTGSIAVFHRQTFLRRCEMAGSCIGTILALSCWQCPAKPYRTAIDCGVGAAESRSLLPYYYISSVGLPITMLGIWGVRMNFSQTKDQRLLAFYEGVRRQVELDSRPGRKCGLAGEDVKQNAELLREEMDRRQLPYNPIAWRGEA